MIALLIQLVVVGLIFWLVLWFVDYVGLPQPFNKVIKVVVGLIAVIYLISLLLGLAHLRL